MSVKKSDARIINNLTKKEVTLRAKLSDKINESF